MTEQPVFDEGLLSAVSWAVAARDAAIEQGAADDALRFTREANQALALAAAAGLTREQIAAELDYPGGSAELDGPHIAVSIDCGYPVTAADLTTTQPGFPCSRTSHAERDEVRERLAEIHANIAGLPGSIDDERAAQLARWHHDDALADDGECRVST